MSASLLPQLGVRGRRVDERGTATIEFVALAPLLVVALALLMQLALFVYTTQAASQAARDGARAYSLSSSQAEAGSAVRASLPGSVRLISIEASGPHHRVKVAVEAPRMFFAGDRVVEREVTMP